MPVKPSPQPCPKPKTLADLLANAEHYARFCMANSGRVTPALFFLAPEGQGMLVPESLTDVSEKDDFANMARLTCVAHAATACVMVIEAWTKFAKAEEKFDSSEAPSEAIDRQEHVVLMDESREGNRHRSPSATVPSLNSAFVGSPFRRPPAYPCGCPTPCAKMVPRKHVRTTSIRGWHPS
jgi:hypothetical protein